MNYARDEAERLGQEHLGPEHILLGLIKEKQNIAVKTLINLGVDLNQLRAAIEANIVKSGPSSHYKQKVFTPQAKAVLENAFDKAKALGHEYIGTEHILLGLLKESEGLVYRVLSSFGVTLDIARQEVANLLGLHLVGKIAPNFGQT